METDGSAKWTADNVKTLLETMNQSIAERVRDLSWITGVKNLDWEIVAFKQFTPEECSAKWHEIMQKLRKIKTLTELIMDAQSVLDDPDSKIKLVEDPQDKLPKRPLSANAIYFAKKQAKLRKRNPGINGPELMKLANEKYRKLPPEVKEKYLLEVEKSKEQYQMGLEKLRSLHPHLKIRGRKRMTTLPLNGYNLFCREQKSLMTGIPQDKITTVWSKRWKRLSQEEKDEYSRRCKEMKILQRKTNENISPGEPKIPTSSKCGIHCKKKMAEMKGEVKNQNELFAKFSRQYKSLSKQERERYQAEIDSNFEMYKDELQKWFKTLTPAEQLEYCEHNPRKLKYLQSKQPASRHRTSDSEDEDLEDSSSDDDLTVIEIDNEVEEEDDEMFDLF